MVLIITIFDAELGFFLEPLITWLFESQVRDSPFIITLLDTGLFITFNLSFNHG